MSKVIVVGSVCIDNVTYTKKIPMPGTTVEGDSFFSNVGGKGANQACAINNLESNVIFFGSVGKDSAGDTIKQTFSQLKLPYKLNESSKPTGSSYIWCETVHAENQIIIIPGANFDFPSPYVDEVISYMEKGDILLLQFEIPMEVNYRLLSEAKTRGLTTILNPAPYREFDAKYLCFVDFFIPNEHEMDSFVQGDNDYVSKANEVIKSGVKNVIVTLGEKGSLYVNEHEHFMVSPFKVDAVDTTCAGDSFCGAFASALLNKKEIKEALRFASKASSITVTKKGAIISLPKLSDIIL